MRALGGASGQSGAKNGALSGENGEAQARPEKGGEGGAANGGERVNVLAEVLERHEKISNRIKNRRKT